MRLRGLPWLAAYRAAVLALAATAAWFAYQGAEDARWAANEAAAAKHTSRDVKAEVRDLDDKLDELAREMQSVRNAQLFRR